MDFNISKFGRNAKNGRFIPVPDQVKQKIGPRVPSQAPKN